MDDRDQKKKSSGRTSARVVVSVGKPRDFSDPSAAAREIIQDARDEAFRIKKSAEEEAVKIRQESLALEKRLADQEDDISKLKKELEIANKGVKDIAIKVIEGDARRSENRRSLKSYDEDNVKEEKFAA